MSVHVQLEFVLPSKALATPLAGEGSLPGVSPDVPVEVRHAGKLGLAVGAGVGTDAVVDLTVRVLVARVSLQVTDYYHFIVTILFQLKHVACWTI